MKRTSYSEEMHPKTKDHSPLLNLQRVTFIPAKRVEEVTPVDIQNAEFVYKEGKKVTGGLFNVSIKIPQGSICAVLGPSGCGKTTLLKTLVGLKVVEKGQVKVFGHDPALGGHESKFGYMPQELCLFQMLDAFETLWYFGSLQLMSKNLLEDRVNFLLKLLNLRRRPGLLVRNMSGGQQRRLSMAVALIHDPPLSLLDEPTVGVDPLLRTTIWRHLQALTQTRGKTVLITTHYIEEARKADMVTFMRNGKILLIGNPDHLLQRFHCVTLEKLFLELCRNSQEEIDDYLSSSTSNVQNQETSKTQDETKERLIKPDNEELKGGTCRDGVLRNELSGMKDTKSKVEATRVVFDECTTISEPEVKRSLKSFMSVVWTNTVKHIILTKRSPIPVTIFLFLPIMNVILVKNYIGGNPFDIPVALLNEEDPPDLGSRFLDSLNNETFKKVYMNNLDEAVQLIREGEVWGAVVTSGNFSDNLITRAEMMDNSMRMSYMEEDRSLRLVMDTSSVIVWKTIYMELLQSYQKFAMDKFQEWQLDPRLALYPLQFASPMGGPPRGSFLPFLIINLLTNSVFIMNLGMVCLSMNNERLQGVIERGRVQGLTYVHIFVSYFVFHSVLTFFQIASVLSFTCATVTESVTFSAVVLTFIICFLNSCTAMAVGMFITTAFLKTFTAAVFALALFQFDLTVSGIFWPHESKPEWFRPFTVLAPETYPVQAVRDLLLRGWGLDHTSVWITIPVCATWTVLFVFLTTIVAQKSAFARKCRSFRRH